jgi:large subunit ribosomal protein L4
MDVKIIDFNSKSTSLEKIDLACNSDLINLENPRSVAYVLNWQLSKRRSGSAQTKTMSEISGTTAKPHKQKGTGHARQGSKRSVQFRGGRTCFGPRVRSFEYKIPKKIIKIAVADVIRLKIKENKLVLFSNINEQIKTNTINKILKDNQIHNALFLYSSETNYADSIVKSIRNIKNFKALNFKGLNVYDILSFDFILLDKDLFSTIKEVSL